MKMEEPLYRQHPSTIKIKGAYMPLLASAVYNIIKIFL